MRSVLLIRNKLFGVTVTNFSDIIHNTISQVDPCIWWKWVYRWESWNLLVIKCVKGTRCIWGQAYQMHLGTVKVVAVVHVCIQMQSLHHTLSLAISDCVLIILQGSLGSPSPLFKRGQFDENKSVASCILIGLQQMMFWNGSVWGGSIWSILNL